MRATLLNESDRALAAVRELMAEGGRQGLDLLVLPECSYPAYLLGSVTSYRRSGCLPGTAYLAELQEGARANGLHIVAGFVHEVGERLYNGAALISPQGEVLGIYHKNLLWHVDSRWYMAGRTVSAFDSELGRIGMLICADARVPELVATLVAEGARLIALPTCWIEMAAEPGRHYNPQSDFLIRARSLEFGVPFVCANKFGVETAGTGYNGQSLITAADGTVLAQADGESPGVWSAELARTEPAHIRVEPGRKDLLLSPPAELPAPPDGPHRIKVALMSGTDLRARVLSTGHGFEGSAAEELFRLLRSAGASLLVTRAPEEGVADRLAESGASFGVAVAAHPGGEELTRQEGLLWGAVSARAAGTFPAIRCLALRGARLVCVLGDTVEEIILRGRALENRIYVAAVGVSKVGMIGANGELLTLSNPDEGGVSMVEIDRRAADDKCVAPDTDIFAQRRPGIYRF